MNELDIDKWYVFYQEHDFRRILTGNFTQELVKEFRDELLSWFHEVPLNKLNIERSQYSRYLNFIDVETNVIGCTGTSFEKITHMYSNTLNFLERNDSSQLFTEQIVSNIVGLYLDFKANIIDSIFWFMRPVVMLDADTYELLCTNSAIFKNLTHSTTEGERMNLPGQNRLNAYSFFGKDTCSLIYSQLQLNEEYSENYSYFCDFFRNEVVLGFYDAE